MRLDKYLASGIGLGSRTDVKKMIKAGRVTVDGSSAVRPETNIDEDTANVCVDGVKTLYRKYVYLMLNKPSGCVSATFDKRYPVVIDFVPDELRHLKPFPVGRLDIDTEGLCILTNDGETAHRVLSPRNHIPKTYYAELNAPIDEKIIEAFKSGVRLDDGYVCMPSEVSAENGDMTAVLVTIYEGKFHQVKRMFEAFGITVTYLRRISMNGIQLDENLELGGIRHLTDDEIRDLKNI